MNHNELSALVCPADEYILIAGATVYDHPSPPACSLTYCSAIEH